MPRRRNNPDAGINGTTNRSQYCIGALDTFSFPRERYKLRSTIIRRPIIVTYNEIPRQNSVLHIESTSAMQLKVYSAQSTDGHKSNYIKRKCKYIYDMILFAPAGRNVKGFSALRMSSLLSKYRLLLCR